MSLPNGSEIIIKTLLSLDAKEDQKDFNQKIKSYARLGIIYVGDDVIKSYCPFCKVNRKNCIFTNENSHYYHSNNCQSCKIFKKYLENFNIQVLTMVSDFLASFQVSMNAICSNKFSKILQYSNPLIKCIKKNDIRKQIFLLFDKYKEEINPTNIGEFCSILIDGASRNLKNFYAFILFTKSRLYYFKIKRMDIATSENIALETREIINYINNYLNIEVISVCTDHASNMVKAFNASDQLSCQILTESFFEWIGCTCHLLNLAISDLDKDNEFQKIKNALLFILSISQKMTFPHKVPTFSKTRWDSFSKCFNFSIFYKDRILSNLTSSLSVLLEKQEKMITKMQRTQNEKINSRYQSLIEEISDYQNCIEIFQSNEYDEVTTIFNYMSNLIAKVGSNNFLLCQVFPEIILLNDFFNTITTENVQKFTQIILDRIFSSNEYIQAATAYFLTNEGHFYILNSFQDEEKENILLQIKFYLFYYNGSKYGDLEDELNSQFENYINYQEIEEDDSENYWKYKRLDPSMSRLAEIAIRIINMPCTEAAVERFFSHLKYVFGKKNYNTSDELLDAEMGIRMENIYSNQEN